MDDKKHAFNVGRLWSQLLSLELVLRYCIGIVTEHHTKIPNLSTLKKRQILKRTAIIDCNNLTSVMQKFNSVFNDLGVRVDKERIRNLRNAVGHGKVLSDSPWPNPMTIFNLDDENKDHVKIVFVVEMTKDWFESNIEFLKQETLKLADFYNKLKNDFLKSLK